MDIKHIAYLIWIIIAIRYQYKTFSHKPFQLTEANNIVLATIALSYIVLSLSDVLIAFWGGYLSDDIVFYERSKGIFFYTMFNLFFINLLLQVFWIGYYRRNIFLSLGMALCLFARELLTISTWRNVTFDWYAMTIDYLRPTYSDVEIAPPIGSYTPRTTSIVYMLQILCIYSLAVGLVYLGINFWNNRTTKQLYN